MEIVKADGTREQFRATKLMSSLRKAGARPSEVRNIVQEIERSLVTGMTTQMIYKRAFELLRNSDDPVAAKYSLRRAVLNLGPTGFPFEDYLGRIFEAEGYSTMRRVLIKGKCATHEVDIAAYSPTDTFVAEAKFHARPGIKSDIQVAMYSYARFLDIAAKPVCKGDVCGIVSLYVITNTKFTSAATKYAECVGIKLLSWDYPKHDSLQDRIDRTGVYPITVLTRLSTGQKQRLLTDGIITCKDIVTNPRVLDFLGIAHNRQKQVVEEAIRLSNGFLTD